MHLRKTNTLHTIHLCFFSCMLKFRGTVLYSNSHFPRLNCNEHAEAANEKGKKDIALSLHSMLAPVQQRERGSGPNYTKCLRLNERVFSLHALIQLRIKTAKKLKPQLKDHTFPSNTVVFSESLENRKCVPSYCIIS